MNPVTIVSVWLVTIVILFSACKKEAPEPTDNSGTNNTANFSFTSLSADSYHIPIGGSTGVKATVSGSNLTYSWSASAGDIFGSGSQITYGASSCCGGSNKVKCTVSDGSSSETKEITIVVQ